MTVSASPSQTKRTYFYLHNTTSTPDVNGYQTFFIMNTSQRWSATPATVRNLQRLYHYWYLYPTLASEYTLNGVISFGIWINATGTEPSGTPTITLYERNVNGTETEVYSYTFGSMQLYNVPSYLNLTVPETVTYTFSKGSSIKLYFEIVVGASTYAQLWFDTMTYDSFLILESADYMQIAWVKTFDANYTERATFETTWNESQRKVIIRANLTDPFGGYDINQVNITLTDPLGNVIWDDKPMNRALGLPVSWSTIFQADWSYPGNAISGTYNISVTAVDNTGYHYNYYYRHYSFGPYLETAFAQFNMGISHQINFLTIDTLSRPLAGANVKVKYHDVLAAQGFTDAYGNFSTLLSTGFYNVSVYWQGTLVNSTINYEVTAPANVTLLCLVYDVEVEVVDSLNAPLEDAEVFIAFPNGTSTILPLHTDVNGTIPLLLTPYGNYNFVVYWRGTIVNRTQTVLDFNGIFTIHCQVYTVTLSLVDTLEEPLANALIVLDAPNGTSNLALFTDLSGNVTLTRISNGTYEFTIIWQLTPILTVSMYTDSNSPIVIECPLYYLTIETVDSIGEALSNAEVFVQSPAGTKAVYLTNSTGHVTLSQVPRGYYNFTVIWLGVSVNSTSSVLIDRNLPVYTISTSVYSLRVQVVDSQGNPMTGVSVILTGSHLTKTGVTDENGDVEFRQLPTGDYNVNASYVGQYAFALWLKTGSESVTLDETQTVTIQLAYPPTSVEVLSSTFPWMLIGVLIAVIAGFLVPMVFKKWKARTKTPKMPK
jgi:hypothetical protein